MSLLLDTSVFLWFVSGDDRHTDRALEAGCDSALLKPIDPEELVTIIRQLARRADGYIGPRAGRLNGS